MNHKRIQKSALWASVLTVGIITVLFAAAPVAFAETDPSSTAPAIPDAEIQTQDEIQDMVSEEIAPEEIEPEEIEPAPVEVWEIGEIKLSRQSCVYTGKAIKPAVTVKGTDGRTLKEGTDFTLSYQNNVKIGTATININGSSTYWGYRTIPFEIVPAAPKLASVKGSKKSLEAKWTAGASQTTGYEILCSTSKSFGKSKKTVRIKSNKSKSKTIKKLKRHQTYYVKVRAYKTVNGKTYYSAWSKSRKTGTK